MARNTEQLYPDFGCFIKEINENGISIELIQKIIQRHKENALYNKNLYEQYVGIEDSIEINKRVPRFKKGNPINNKLHCAFVNEIVDFKTGYFVGKPIAYGYSRGNEAEQVTGGEIAVDVATKAVTDFVVRNNMYGVDMETVKRASICGYAGRLFYIDLDGNERVIPTHSFETIILSNTDISEPEYAIRYFYNLDINNSKRWTVEFYDSQYIYTYEGGSLGSLKETDIKPHMFDYCPLQGIMNNSELTGDAEIVMSLINDYDKVLSDNSNEIESFVHAMMVVTVLGDPKKIAEEIDKANDNGKLVITPTGNTQINEPVKWLTKNINDTFTEHHLERIEKLIYKHSKTPNMNDDTFGNASGEALRMKLHELETKCGMCQASMMNSAKYMWKLLSAVWAKKRIVVDPLQVTMVFKRNYPTNHLANAQAAQALIAAQVPKRAAWEIALEEVDDVNYLEELAEEELDVMSLYANIPQVQTTQEETNVVETNEQQIDK